MIELTVASFVTIGSAVVSALAAITPFVWSFSSWKTKVESKLDSDDKRISAIEALDIWVELAKMNTTLKHIELWQDKIERLLTKK